MSHTPDMTQAESATIGSGPTKRRTRRSPTLQEKPSVGVDVVIFTVIDSDLKVLLAKREGQPFKGVWSLPGGLVRVRNSGDQGEGIEQAAHRELSEATGLTPGSCFVEQLYTFGKAGRDPRGRVISVAWIALVSPDQGRAIHPGDQGDAQWFSTHEEIPWMRLAFDHAEILDTAVERIRGKLDHSNIAFELVPETFTVAELRDTYEAIKSRTYDARNFRRRFQRMIGEGVVTEAPGKRHRGKARPAKIWRLQR